MTALWLSIIGLLLTAVLIIFLPLFIGRKAVSSVSDQQQQNIAIFKDRLSELEQEKSQGNINEAVFLQLKTELEKSLLADVDGNATSIFSAVTVTGNHWLIVASMAFFVVLASLAMYVDLGRSEDYGSYLTLKAQAEVEAKATEKNQAKLKQLMDLLKTKLKENPSDTEKWFLLANSYAAIGQYQQAAEVYLAAMNYIDKTDSKYATAKGSYSQMLFQAAGEQVTPAAIQAMQEALAIDPLEPSALILAGIYAYTLGDLKQAVLYWEKAKTKADENVITTFIDPVITQAKMQLAQAAPQMSQAQASTGKAKISLKLDIAPELKAKVSPEQTVFVFARPVGGKMPLAAEKLQVKDLPKTIILDDSKSPMPTANLSSVAEVDVTARVSLSGQPQQSKGDLFVTAEKVKTNEAGKVLELLINQEVP
jgi:cytochrome c-type biogenesis protein CcmH